MPQVRFFVLSAMAICVIAFSLLGCTKAEELTTVETADGKEQTAQILRRRLSSEPRGIDPHLSSDTVSSQQCGLAYEGLYEYDYFQRPAAIRPALAATMPEVSDQGRTYTFTIRNDAFFQDNECFPDGKGRKMGAADFVYSVKRMASLAKSNGWAFMNGKIVGLDQFRDLMTSVGEGLPPDQKKAMRDEAFKREVAGIQVIDSIEIPESDPSAVGTHGTHERVRIKLNKKYPQFLWILTMSYTAVVPHEAVERYGVEFRFNPVGTGPFVLKEWRYNHGLEWVRNPSFHADFYPVVKEDAGKQPSAFGTIPDKSEFLANSLAAQGFMERDAYLADAGKRLPLADEIHFTVIKETQPAWLEFQAGHFDLSAIDKDNFGQVIANGDLTEDQRARGIRLVRYADPSIEYWSFNLKDPVVGTKAGKKGLAIRRALTVAFNREEYIDRYYNGRGVNATGLIPPGLLGHVSQTGVPFKDVSSYAKEGSYEKGLVKAREILKEAGFSVEQSGGMWSCQDGGKELELGVLVRTPALTDNARYFVQTARKIGIKINPEIMQFQEFLKRQDEERGQIYHAGWVMDYPDAENMLFLLHSEHGNGGSNSANYQNPDYDKLYDEMAALTEDTQANRDRKIELIGLMHAELNSDDPAKGSPWLPIKFGKAFTLEHEWYSPGAPLPFSYSFLKYRSADSEARVEAADEWSDKPILPGLLIFLLAIVPTGLFVTKLLLAGRR